MPDWTSSPFYSTAIDAAQRFGVPTNLFVAQIGQESSFNPNAQNGNATGIAQFIPATAIQYGVNASDPVSSLYGAAKYDAALHSQYGSWQAAMQKYGTTANGAGAGVASIAAQADQGSLGSYYDAITGAIGNVLAPGFQYGAQTDAVKKPVTGAIKGVTSLLDILTDLSRVVTVLVGLILLIVGLAGLGAKPAVQIVEKAKGLVGI